MLHLPGRMMEGFDRRECSGASPLESEWIPSVDKQA